jgi:prepilin-type N-terminal cleavage/methylation domain-containing protein/prepilin-type processing-associated H-X9-DG protein
MKNKFTLIELLVVVAIMGILMSMLLPELSKARMASYNTVCINNLGQTAKIHHMFADDNKERPVGITTGYNFYFVGDNFGEDRASHRKNRPLTPYYKDNYTAGDEINALRCPTESVIYDQYGTSYSTNMGYFNGHWGNNTNDFSPTLSLSSAKNPSRMVLVEELQAYWRISGRVETQNKYKSHFYKKDRVNLAFTDGHVDSQVQVGYGSKNTEEYTFDNEYGM